MVDMQWLREQVEAFERARPRFLQYANLLRDVLQHASDRLAPLSIVQARAKSVPSFTEKILRKNKYRDPLRDMTDLCGVRVITHTQAEIQRVCRFIRDHFEVDEANSLDTLQRLRATEFGYRAVHYVVRFQGVAFPSLVPLTIPEELYGLKAEIQVRTIAQHAWADIGHDRLYKSSFKIPDRSAREFARAAAMLENADEAFAKLAEEVDAYRASYDAYMSTQRMQEELDILRAVFDKDDENPDLARRIARLAICLEEWDQAIHFLQGEFQGEMTPALRICLGFAYCQKHRDQRESDGYRQGRDELQQVVRQHPNHLEALTLLGDTWIGIEDKRALIQYAKAFQIDATHPAALAGYLALKIAREGNAALASMFASNLQAAIDKCREQIEIGINLPAAWYYLGQFLALRGKSYESLAAYCRGIALTSGRFMLDAALRPIEKLGEVRNEIPELDWILRLLRLAQAAKFSPHPKQALDDLISDPDWQISPPVVIVAGGCDPAVEEEMQTYRDLLVAAFEGFRGTILSGGTTAGISGLVGELMTVYPGQICTIGYVPKYTPSNVHEDDRYSELRRHQGTDFSALEPIQNWIDLVAAGVRPWQVKVLGINGGRIAAFEYRLALAMGAHVGVLEQSGREAGTVIREAEWQNIEGLARLFPDPKTLNTFVHYGGPCSLTPDDLGTLAKTIHDAYRDEQKDRFLRKEPAMADWNDLRDDFRQSNLQQASHIDQKLAAVGKKAVTAADPDDIVLAQFTDEEVERLAEMEHARWNVERLLAGWTLGPRDPAQKTSPYLVSWDELPDDVREWDRSAVRHIPELLNSIGLEIQPR